jgi:hypothetical protein
MGMKSSKTAKNVTKSTTYALQEKEPDHIESLSQGDVGAIETIDLNLITKDSGNSTYVVDERKDFHEAPFASTASLAVMLGQLVAYFTGRADIDDMDVLSFSLHHLFCRIDLLYRRALPALQANAGEEVPQTSCHKGLSNHSLPPSPLQTHLTSDPRYRQRIWSELQRINRTLDRMEPLCHLLSDATECILDAFDRSSANGMTDAEEGTILDQPPSATDKRLDTAGEQSWLHILDSERWEQALIALTESLEDWQQSYRTSTPFTTQFARLMPRSPILAQLDTAFTRMLECAGTIFGDILPGFRAIARGDEETVAAHLFDLMQQSDQLLVQFDMTLEPMNELIKQFAIEVRLSDLNHNTVVLTGT